MPLRAAMLALMGLSITSAAVPAPLEAGILWLTVGTCHGGTVSIPLQKEPDDGDQRCPGACHVLCARARVQRGDDDACA